MVHGARGYGVVLHTYGRYIHAMSIYIQPCVTYVYIDTYGWRWASTMRMALKGRGDGQGVHGRATEGVGGKRWRDWEGDGVRSCTSGYVLTYLLTYIRTFVHVLGIGLRTTFVLRLFYNTTI